MRGVRYGYEATGHCSTAGKLHGRSAFMTGGRRRRRDFNRIDASSRSVTRLIEQKPRLLKYGRASAAREILLWLILISWRFYRAFRCAPRSHNREVLRLKHG